MDTQIKHEQEIRLQVVRIIAEKSNTPPEKILKVAIPLSEWILKNIQMKPSNTANKK